VGAGGRQLRPRAHPPASSPARGTITCLSSPGHNNLSCPGELLRKALSFFLSLTLSLARSLARLLSLSLSFSDTRKSRTSRMLFASDRPRVGWERCHDSRRCSRDTYPESYITEYTVMRRQARKEMDVTPLSSGDGTTEMMLMTYTWKLAQATIWPSLASVLQIAWQR
jgi:hypothetical protein